MLPLLHLHTPALAARQLLLLLPALLLLGPIALAAAKLESDLTIISLLGPATSYEAHARLRPLDVRYEAANMSTVADPVGHVPAFIYILSRHTMRNPSAAESASINSLAPLIKRLANSSAAALHPWLKTWVSPVPKQGQGEAAPLGVQQTQRLGKRYARRYPSLVPPTYQAAALPTLCTKATITSQTALAFLKGFMPSASRATPLIKEDGLAEPLLRFPEMCPSYLKYKDSVTPWTGAVLHDLEAEMGAYISRQLNLDFNLSACDVNNLWNACSYEGGSLLDVNKTCSLFDKSNAKMMQWAVDVEAYMTKGNATPINYLIAAPLLDEITRYLTTAVTANPEVSGYSLKLRLAVAGAEALTPLSTLLGLFNDSTPDGPITRAAANSSSGCPAPSARPPLGWVPPFDSSIYRRWKQDSIAPYNAHIAFVLYRNSSAAAGARSLSSYLVRLLYNELQLAVPGCTSASVDLDCPLTRFLDIYKHTADPRQFDTMCNTSFYKYWQGPAK